MSIFGIVVFLLLGGMAFWMLLFLMGFVLPYWITLGAFDMLRPKRIYEEEEEASNARPSEAEEHLAQAQQPQPETARSGTRVLHGHKPG